MSAPSARRALRMLMALVVVALLLSSCAAGPNTLVDTQPQSGFLMGLWHGSISPITFVVSLFDEDVTIYEVHNTGHWYDLGFVLGCSVAFSAAARSGGAGSSRSRRRGPGSPSCPVAIESDH